jgi:hypothetical protein
MVTARQVIRWSIPGSIALLLTTIYELVHIVVYDDLAMLDGIRSINPALAAALIVAGIPLGYLIDQVYYALYGRVLPLDVVPADRGAAVLARLPQEACSRLQRRAGIAVLETQEMSEEGWPGVLRLKKDSRNQEGRERFKQRHREHQSILRFAVMTLDDDTGAFRGEYTSLSDVYHSLGSTRYSIVIATSAFVVLHAIHFLHHPQGPTMAMVVTYLLAGAIASAAFAAVEAARRGTNETFLQFLHFALHTYPRAGHPGRMASSTNGGRAARQVFWK